MLQNNIKNVYNVWHSFLAMVMFLMSFWYLGRLSDRFVNSLHCIFNGDSQLGGVGRFKDYVKTSIMWYAVNKKTEIQTTATVCVLHEIYLLRFKMECNIVVIQYIIV